MIGLDNPYMLSKLSRDRQFIDLTNNHDYASFLLKRHKIKKTFICKS